MEWTLERLNNRIQYRAVNCGGNAREVHCLLVIDEIEQRREAAMVHAELELMRSLMKRKRVHQIPLPLRINSLIAQQQGGRRSGAASVNRDHGTLGTRKIG